MAFDVVVEGGDDVAFFAGEGAVAYVLVELVEGVDGVGVASEGHGDGFFGGGLGAAVAEVGDGFVAAAQAVDGADG